MGWDWGSWGTVGRVGVEVDWLWAWWDGLGSLSTVGWVGIGMD